MLGKGMGLKKTNGNQSKMYRVQNASSPLSTMTTWRHFDHDLQHCASRCCTFEGGVIVRVCLHFPHPLPTGPVVSHIVWPDWLTGRSLPIVLHIPAWFPDPMGKSLGLPRHFSNSRSSSNYIPILIQFRTPIFYTLP